MTAAHFLFALLTAACILIAIRLEERDLVALHGETRESYLRQVPMLVPQVGKAWKDEPTTAVPALATK